MELVSAICPACGRNIEVDRAEEVDFCKLCGKPFAVNNGINLYAESVECNAVARKPSDEVIAKFNAILAQDYKLAKQYLDNFVKKEYPKLPLPYVSWCYDPARFVDKDWSYQKDRIKGLKTDLDKTEEEFKKLNSLNPQIAEAYYKLFCAAVNALFNENRDLIFTRHLKYCAPLTGGLPFLKLRLIGLEDSLYNSAHIIENEIGRYEIFCGKEFDDVYIDATISLLPFWGKEYVRKNLYANNAEINKGVKNLTICLEKFLSPAKKREKQVQEERAQQEKEKKKREKELAFWQQYIELLKAGKAKEAVALLEKKKKPSQTDEFAKFKKSLFGVKYKGDISSLNAYTLAAGATNQSAIQLGDGSDNGSTISSK